ncbi:uncharacterized protein LOC135476390 [Liolophura sinensis]|uniref:uncharacterized protein LOC135476390 n=1 Tax=Liolophura sinensis TaxID=3198878 RepID=UPI0031586D05
MWRITAIFLLILIDVSHGCFFPDVLTRNDTQPWTGHIHNSEGRNGDVLLYFRENRMSGFVYKGSGDIPDVKSLGVATFNRTCVNSVSANKFLVMHDEDGERPRYLCMEIIMRSKSVFQLSVSGYSTHIDPLLCYTADMKLDPWLYVSFESVVKDHTVCSFSGGYNMKIRSSSGSAFGCNSMELPMRLEAECIKGEGIYFQFRYETCKEDLPLEVDQRTFCTATWIDGRFTYSLLRRFGRKDLWCLRTPLIRTHNFTSVLFLQGMCGDEETYNSSVKFVTINLEETQFNDVCQDEYSGCTEKRCTEYTEQSCPKSCGLCHPGEQMFSCKFPKPYRGDWLQTDFDSKQQVQIASSKISIQNMGNFKCVRSEKTTERVERKYALVSLFSNGCRPRFTCVAFRRFGHSVLAFTMSKSIAWPFPPRIDVPETVCKDSQFEADPSPMRDTFRGNLDTFKTVISQKHPRSVVNCQLRQVHKIQGNFNGTDSCKGELYEDCNDPTRLRMDIEKCGHKTGSVDFRCLSTYEGKYWERITILQNLEDPTDARCIIFSEVRAGEMLMMTASECDRNSWVWASGGKRHALGKFNFQTDDISCKIVPTKPPTTPRPPQVATYRILTSSEVLLSATTHRNLYGQRQGSKTVTRVATPPSESLAKDSNLQSDSGNVAVVEAPSRDNPPSSGSRLTHPNTQEAVSFLGFTFMCYLISRS